MSTIGKDLFDLIRSLPARTYIASAEVAIYIIQRKKFFLNTKEELQLHRQYQQPQLQIF